MKKMILISLMLLCFVFSMAVSILGQATNPIIYQDDLEELIDQSTKPTYSPEHITKKPGLYTITDWQNVIDSTWGWGVLKAEKLQIFDNFWNGMDDYFACFNGIDVNWDSLRTVYRTEIENGDLTYGVSRGRFAGIMNHLCMALKDAHTFVSDRLVNWHTLPEPGVPLLFLGTWGNNWHFGAGLTPLPDSSLLVYKAIVNHPLGLEPGDIVLGYDGVPWKDLYQDLLAAQLPVTGIYRGTTFIGGSWWGGCESAFTHSLLFSAGANWHLFDSLDVVKYGTNDTLRLATSLLIGQDMELWNTEQMDIPGVPMPDYDAGERATFGIIDGTQIGYIYVWGWTQNVETEFYNAIYTLMNSYETTGLIIDFRGSRGGDIVLSNDGLSLLFNETVTTVDFASRCSPGDHFTLCPYGHPESYTIPGDSSTYYDKPIAVLTGPGAISAGDQNALRMKFHPMVKFFGKPTSSAFNHPTTLDLGNADWYCGFAFYNTYLVDNPSHYLTHDEFPSEADFPGIAYEEVWLTPDNVAQGIDDVVQAAIEWINLRYYLPGDANMYNGIWPPQCIGSDVTYLVNYFRGQPANQPCEIDGFWASADANGDCNIIGSDVTRLVNYFRGNVSLLYCPDYEPLWLTPDDLPDEAPDGWPGCE